MNATDTNHINSVDKAVVRELITRHGAAEVLRTISQIVANDHDDLHFGSEIRSQINAIAKRLV